MDIDTAMPKQKSGKEPKPVKLRSGEGQLQVYLMQAVALSRLEAVEKAGGALKQHCAKYITIKKARRNRRRQKVLKQTGPQVLDFILSREAQIKVPAQHKAQCKTHSPLMMALELGRTDIAEKLIELDASVAFKNKDGLTALHIACNKGMTGIVRRLLDVLKHQHRFSQKKGAKKSSDCEEVVNARERPKGWTPVMYAVKGGHVDIVRTLIECGFLKYDTLNQKGQNVCHIAAREGQLECLKLLHDKSRSAEKDPFLHKDKKRWNLLHQVCCRGDVETLKWLLETIPGLNTRESLNLESQTIPGKRDPSAPELCYTPLLVACLYKKLGAVAFLTSEASHLVDFTACCHRDGGRGTSALHLAAVHDDVDMAKELIGAGCPLDGLDIGGNNILHVAKRWSSGGIYPFIATECVEKDIDLTKTRNLDGKLPSEVEEENVVPLEIKKRGPEAVQIFIHALNEGKEKIPYCGLLILGRQQVGKTSLYRQLVRMSFMLDLDSTRGINNNTVDTVEKRPLGIEKGKWKEKNRELDRSERFIDGLSNELMDALPANPESAAAQGGEVEEEVGEEELLAQIRNVITMIEKSVKPVPVPSSAARPRAPDTPPTKRHRTKPPPPKVPKLAAPKARPRPPKVAHKPRPKRPGTAPRETAGPPPPKGKEQPDPTPPPTPGDPDTPVERDDPTPRLEPWESVKINSIIKARTQDKKEPSLLLNTLDFAGQEIYRPMHYCFISRRALYVVVFKIPDMTTKSGANVVIEELRYWINSVHARIYPPDELVEKEDKKMNRVFLVGTHRGSTPMEALRKIDCELKEGLIMGETNHTCVNHIHRRSSSDQNLKFFFPVENSIDFQKDEDYLVESGTKFFQEEVETKCGGLSFLNEDHPRKWLKFEESLEQCDIARSSAPVMSLDDVRGFASRAGIVGEDMQDLALKFLHDTGKIIYLDCLPHLFLTEAEHKQLAGHVVLRPEWLMSIMQVVMELTTDREEQNLSQDQVKGVEKDGVADLELLEVCWQKFLGGSLSDIGIHHLCLILQAYCLIYPYLIQSDVTTAGANGMTPRKYVIPCKLPDQFRGKELQPKNCATFYFDFNLFLPVEIYHKLICLASSKAKPRFGTCSQYSRTKCSFSGLLETKWVMEIEQDKHRLKIMVIVGRDKDSPKPVEYMIFIHEILRDICNESGLKGLEYRGGPVDQCDRCGDDDIMFCYVELHNGEDKVHVAACCTSCLAKYDVNKLLYLADLDQSNLLGTDNLKDVLEMVREIAAVYDDLSLALKLSSSFLDVVEADEPSCNKRLTKVVVEWLKGNGGERSWKFLSEAIRGPLVKNKALADKIEKKYCKN